MDKKVAKDIVTPPTLDLSGTVSEELTTYLLGVKAVKGEGLKRLLTLFEESVNYDND